MDQMQGDQAGAHLLQDEGVVPSGGVQLDDQAVADRSSSTSSSSTTSAMRSSEPICPSPMQLFSLSRDLGEARPMPPVQQLVELVVDRVRHVVSTLCRLFVGLL